MPVRGGEVQGMCVRFQPRARALAARGHGSLWTILVLRGVLGKQEGEHGVVSIIDRAEFHSDSRGRLTFLVTATHNRWC